MNPTKSFLYISIFVVVIFVLVSAVKAEPLHRTTCADLREVSHKSCAMVTKTVVAKKLAPAPTPTQKPAKKPASLPAKADKAIPAPSDTKAAKQGGTTARDEIRTDRLVLANFIGEDD
jgi:hypothetical protein